MVIPRVTTGYCWWLLLILVPVFAAKQPKDAFMSIYKELKDQYNAVIVPENDLQWVFINAGGSMWSGCIVHASLTEYILFVGSALDTSGHSG